MATELIINASLPETRIALIENGEIQDLLIERASGKGIVGNIYRGRVTRVLPGMQAAFVDIGLDKAAFLYVDDVYVHSEIWEEEEGTQYDSNPLADVPGPDEAAAGTSVSASEGSPGPGPGVTAPTDLAPSSLPDSSPETTAWATEEEDMGDDDSDPMDLMESEGDDEDDDGTGKGGSHRPVGMSADPRDLDDQSPEKVAKNAGDSELEGTVAPSNELSQASAAGQEGSVSQGQGTAEGNAPAGSTASGDHRGRRPHSRRGRRGGRYRRRGPNAPTEREQREGSSRSPGEQRQKAETYPESYNVQIRDSGELVSDRSTIQASHEANPMVPEEGFAGRPQLEAGPIAVDQRGSEKDSESTTGYRQEFRAQRSRDRRIRPRSSMRPVRNHVDIQGLLKEGQEVLVQVAKDPIATKGARLTCHISLPGRHLVCMPTIDHVGVSRRIEREDERRRLRDFVERNRPKNLGFIVRTASGKQQSEKRIKQDIDYLSRLWTEIREKTASVTAPALVYEDLNSILRAIRDWVTEDIDKIIVDSRYHFNEIQRFVSHFMPSLRQKVELYHGDIPIFDAYNISTELSRALERKVWLKSGGYIVIDQAEALVAIDVNTGRYVGKRNLEDTILKTNLEAVQEIAYQLRLRNCGGIIILDLIDMEKEENRLRVYRALEEALKRDRARPTILKISELGLVEMTRKRTRDTLVRALCESCSHCEGKSFIKSKQTVAYEVLREVEREGIERDVGKVLVRAHSDVIDILAIEERETLDQLERKYRKQIYLQAITDFHPEQFEVVADKKPRKEQNEVNDRNNRYRNRSQPRSHAAESSQNGETRETRYVHDGGGIPRSPDAGVQELREPTAPVGVNVSSMNDSASAKLDSPSSIRSSETGYDEEDRLAFLRAQAAQDAALAGLRSSGSSTSRLQKHVPGSRQAKPGGHAPGDRNSGGGGDRGKRGGKRGRRGGRFRRNPSDHRTPNHSGFRSNGSSRGGLSSEYSAGPVPKEIPPAVESDVPQRESLPPDTDTGNTGTSTGGGSQTNS